MLYIPGRSCAAARARIRHGAWGAHLTPRRDDAVGPRKLQEESQGLLRWLLPFEDAVRQVTVSWAAHVIAHFPPVIRFHMFGGKCPAFRAQPEVRPGARTQRHQGVSCLDPAPGLLHSPSVPRWSAAAQTMPLIRSFR